MRRLGIDARKVADYGIGTYIRGLLAELAGRDDLGEVVLLVAPSGRDLLPPLPPSWRVVEVEAPGYSLKEQVLVPLAAMRAGVSVLHVPHYVVPLLFPGRLLVTIHDIIHVLFPEFLPSRLGLAYAGAMIRRAVRRARWVITASLTTANDLRRFFGASEERLKVVPHGVLPAFTAQADAGADALRRQRYGLPGQYLLHVGNHKPHKNAEGVLKAYQMLVHQSGQQVPPLVFVGGFSADGPLAQRARAMGLGRAVHCLGHVSQEDLAALYRGARCFIYPTLYEGFGLPVLEAMASGTPVVAGDVAAVREVAGDAVLRVNPRDTVALAAAVRRLVEDDDLCLQLREKGRRRAAAFRWSEAAAATAALYREVRKD